MDSDFMSNLNNMMKNGNVPDDIKNILNNLKNNNQNNMNEQKHDDSNSNSNINPDFIKNVMSMFGNANTSNNSDNVNSNTGNFGSSGDFGNIDINMLFKVKNIMDKMNSNKNDPRSNLLLSLKPYLKESRKNKVEQYIRLA